MSKTKRKKRQLAKTRENALRTTQVSAPSQSGVSFGRLKILSAMVVLAILTTWAYWPTLVWMEQQWRNEPDYSHGYLVIPLAMLLLHRRRDIFPAEGAKFAWGGVGLLILAILLRVAGRLAYMDFLDGWTLVPWVAGLVWIFGGRQMLWWALPAVFFLLLLTPMPYRAESMLSFKLQSLSTILSSTTLLTLGFPAITEGNTIWLGEQQLMVEEACSGLRIFMGMIAMGFFFAVLARRSWLDRVIILAAAAPIAILVNSLRVTGTGLAFHWLTAEQAHKAHDWLGFLMIFAGAGMLLAVSAFWENLYRPVETSLVSRQRLVST